MRHQNGQFSPSAEQFKLSEKAFITYLNTTIIEYYSSLYICKVTIGVEQISTQLEQNNTSKQAHQQLFIYRAETRARFYKKYTLHIPIRLCGVRAFIISMLHFAKMKMI